MFGKCRESCTGCYENNIWINAASVDDAVIRMAVGDAVEFAVPVRVLGSGPIVFRIDVARLGIIVQRVPDRQPISVSPPAFGSDWSA